MAHQRSLLDDTSAAHAQPSLGQKPLPDHFQLPPLQATSSNKKADKNKSRSSNGNNNGGNGNGNNAGSGSGHLSSGIHSQNTTAAIEAAAQESRVTLQALLMVMTSSMSGTDKDMATSSSSSLDSGAQAQVYRGATVAVGPGGPTGGVAMSATGAAPPMRSHYHPIQQLSRYSSHPSLSMSPTPVTGVSSYSQQQQHQQPAIPLPFRNNKSQSVMSSTTATNPLVQATNAILNPLSLQELALLLAYLLSVAPEQWIPWHLYDFFIRPQGRKYKDLIEMLPTHSQRILKVLLETVEALVEYATGVAVLQQRKALQHHLQQQAQQQQQQQSGKQQQQQAALAHLRSKSEVDPGHSRSNGGYGAGGNPTLRPSGSSTLSLARALAILEPPFSAQELLQIQQQQQQKAILNAATQGGDSVHQEIALRGRKRRVIMDSLSGLVFRPRQSEAHRASGAGGGSVGTMGALIESPTDNSGGGLLVPEEKGAGNGGKGKAMRRRSFLGAATTPSSSGSAAATAAPSPAAVALQLQMSEREREAGHLAFENLVSAFEADYVRPYPSALATIGLIGAGAGAGAGADAKAAPTGGAEAGTELQDELPNVTLPQSLVDAGSVARIRSSNTPPGSQGVANRSAAALPPTGLPPRQAMSLPTAVSTPMGTDLAAMRSLSLPPWRKKHHSALQLGQQLSPSLSITMARQQEWLPQYPFQPQAQVQSGPPVSTPTSRSASALSVVAPGLNQVLTTSSNGAVESPSEELPENLQSPVPPPVSVSGSTITLPALTVAEVSVAPIVTGNDAVVSETLVDVDDDAGATVTVRARGSPEVVTATTTATMAATLPRRTTSRRSSTKKQRPMSLDNIDDTNADNNNLRLLRTRTLSGTISSTWTAWKDHLLVLEEEEYVIEDSSESLSIVLSSSSSGESFSSGYSDSEDGGGEEGRQGGGHDNEHDADDSSTRDFDTRQQQQGRKGRRRKDGKETVTPAVGSGGEGEAGRRTNKSSGTFGDLGALAAVIAASQQKQQQQRAGSGSNNNASGGSSGGGAV
ncbi:hypothetical protein BGW39_006068 [Mortierella sp. 14UC]|nr:hypothetical protein BGW39_006068 [Mortierella sp. 14UC]